MGNYDYDCAADLLDRRVEFVGIGMQIRLNCRVIAVLESVPGDCFSGVVQVQLSPFGPEPSLEVLRLDLSRYVAETITA